MELKEVEKTVTDVIVSGLPVTNKLTKLKGLKEWEMVTRLIKLELSAQVTGFEDSTKNMLAK